MTQKIIQKEQTKHNLICGDLLEVLDDIESKSIDLVFADPPYNLGKNFGKKTQKLSVDDYVDWSIEWFGKIKRILKPTGSFYLMNSTQNMPFIDIYLLFIGC
ncbi:MAG: DNA methyltransferase [Candidatus Heimdallarchaeota archaeon]